MKKQNVAPYIIGSLGVRFVSAIALALATDEARNAGSAVFNPRLN